MRLLPYEQKYAVQVAALLNDFLPFELETADTVEQAGGIRYLAVNEQDEVIGYIAGYKIVDFHNEFPYFHEELRPLQQLAESGISYYTSHFVVHPNERKKGIGKKLVQAYLEKAQDIAKTIITVGWVPSDTNRWAAERHFVAQGFEPFIYLPRYFESYQVECPSCNGLCYCDAHIFINYAEA